MQYANRATLIWSIAELLRGYYKHAEYGKVILPFTLLRRSTTSKTAAFVGASTESSGARRTAF